MRKSTLRVAGAALCLGMLASGCADDADADSEGHSVDLGQQFPSMVLPAVIAENHGLMQDAGIDEVELVSLQDPAALLRSVDKGQVDVAVGVPPAVAPFNEQSGADLTFIRGGLWLIASFAAADGSDLPAATADDWETAVRAWEGRTVGVPAFGGTIDLIVRSLIEQVGLEEGDVDLLAVGAGASSVAALEQGTVDVVLAEPVALQQLESSGAGYPVLQLGGEMGPEAYRDVLASGVFTAGDRVSDEVMSDFAEGWQAGVDFMMDPDNEAEVVSDIADFMELDTQGAEAFYGYVSQYDTNLDSETWDKTLEAYVSTGVMPEPADPDALVSPLP